MIAISILLSISFFYFNFLWIFIFYAGIVLLAGSIIFFCDTIKEHFLIKQFDLPQRYEKGSYALITGGVNGIGLGYAKQLLLLGFNLVLVDCDQKGLKKAKKEILEKTNGVDVVLIQGDLTKIKGEEFKELLSPALDKDVSILINNVGIANCLPFEESTPKIIHDIIHLNSTSYAVITSLFYQNLVAHSTFKNCITNLLISTFIL